MPLPTIGPISMSAIATDYGVSTSNISLYNLGYTANHSFTSNINMSYFYPPPAPHLEDDGSYVDVLADGSTPYGATVSFFRTGAGSPSSGHYYLLTSQVGIEYLDYSISPSTSYYYKVSFVPSGSSISSPLSDYAHIVTA